MIQFIQRMLCKHTFEYEWDRNTNQHVKICRKCDKEI